MRKLNEDDLANVIGFVVQGYRIEKARIYRGPYSDSDHYGIALGIDNSGNNVTWQFHLDENENPYVYWGHYHLENREAALLDFENRDLKGLQDDTTTRLFEVTITETLKLTVEIEAKDCHEAEQAVSDKWNSSEYVLSADNFSGVEFEAAIVCDESIS